MLEILDKIGFAICHQLPERSFHVHEYQLPLCSRCTGIYLGFFSTLTFYFFVKFIKHKKPSLPPNMKIGIISIVFILSMFFNAVSPIFNIPTSNILRFITGILFGMSLPLFLIPAINYSPKSDHDQERIVSWKEYIILITICCLLIIPVFFQIEIVLSIISYISIIGLLLFILLVNTAIIALILENIKKIKLTPYYYSLLLGAFISGIELYLFSYLHFEILGELVK